MSKPTLHDVDKRLVSLETIILDTVSRLKRLEGFLVGGLGTIIVLLITLLFSMVGG